MQSQRDEQGQAGDDERTEAHQQTSAEEERIEAKIDRDLLDSFPASDPPGWTMGTRKPLPRTDDPEGAEGDASAAPADEEENGAS